MNQTYFETQEEKQLEEERYNAVLAEHEANLQEILRENNA